MAAADEQLSTSPGIYVLGLRLDHAQQLRIGALGDFMFPAGYYLYVGSAWGPGGLRARVGRHLRGGPIRRWHIDYLRAVATPCALWVVPEASNECAWAMQLLALSDARMVAPRFGASDCSCPAHLMLLNTDSLNAALLPQAQAIPLE
ncbi:MAG: GIY-YIG nuclease family protein [Anaerolineae bacterium]|nr:GIY-YIG nuclease family protein [Anaerolineae bacterium]